MSLEAFQNVSRDIAGLTKKDVLKVIDNLGNLPDINARASICDAIFKWEGGFVTHPTGSPLQPTDEVRNALASSPFLTENVQIQMVEAPLFYSNSQPGWLLHAARNPALTKTAQEKFSDHSHHDVVREFCSNTGILPEIQKKLMGGGNTPVFAGIYGHVLARNPSLTQELALYHADPANGSDICQTVAQHQPLPESIQLKILEAAGPEDKGYLLQFGLAQNPHATPDVQVQMAKHPSDMVRWNLARNEGIVIEAQTILAQDEHNGVREMLDENPAVKQNLVDAVRDAGKNRIFGALGIG